MVLPILKVPCLEKLLQGPMPPVFAPFARQAILPALMQWDLFWRTTVVGSLTDSADYLGMARRRGSPPAPANDHPRLRGTECRGKEPSAPAQG
jgi:hypothetical protein